MTDQRRTPRKSRHAVPAAVPPAAKKPVPTVLAAEPDDAENDHKYEQRAIRSRSIVGTAVTSALD